MRKIELLLFILLALSSTGSLAQVKLSGSLTEYLENKIDHMPGEGTNVYQNPTEAEAEIFKIAILKLEDGDYHQLVNPLSF